MIGDLIGRRCSTVQRVWYRLGDEPSPELAAVELGWDDDRFTTLSAKSDWTLKVTFLPWKDPLAGASAAERQELAGEVGLWQLASCDDDRTLIHRDVSAVEPILNEVGELVGLELIFGDVELIARIYEGNLTLEVGGA